MYPPLAEYYKRLRLVTSGNLFDFERLKTIIGFQIGAYDHYLDAYKTSTEYLDSPEYKLHLEYKSKLGAHLNKSWLFIGHF